MNTVIACLLVLSIVPVSCSWISGYYRQRQFGKIDNKEPRIQAARLSGPGARAVAAQANSWEALGVFSAAVLAIVISGVGMERIATLAIVFTALRVVYVPLYLGNLDALRSLVFIAAYGICMYLFYIALSN